MFLSVTNLITYEIAPIPLLWVIPLAVYLFSFVLAFKKIPWCPAWIDKKIYFVLASGLILFLLSITQIIPFAIQTILVLFLLFILCLFCHFRLNKDKPEQTSDLTVFYLSMATGGFFGGIFVSWVAPLIFKSMLEFLAGLLVIALALSAEKKPDKVNFNRHAIISFLAMTLTLIIWPVLFKKYDILGIIVLFVILGILFNRLKNRPLLLSLHLSAAILIFIFSEPLWENDLLYKFRNYYGIYKVEEKHDMRRLINGTTLHGIQFVSGERELEPVGYYHKTSPVAKLMTDKDYSFNSIGILGLGMGGLAGYGRKGSSIDFFELDPAVFTLAQKYFSFLEGSHSDIKHYFGDARISLKKIPDMKYDLFIMDAFSSDSIPEHLLTTNAIEEYLRCLKQDGIILFHISSRYITLRPVLQKNCSMLRLYGCSATNNNRSDHSLTSEWFAITANKETYEKLIILGFKNISTEQAQKEKNLRAWTDDYSNILQLINLHGLLDQIKSFMPFYWDMSIWNWEYYCNAVLRRDKKSRVNYYLKKASDCLAENQLEDVVDYCEKIESISPSDFYRCHFVLGSLCFKIGDYNKAIDYWQKAAEEKVEKKSLCYKNISFAFLKTGNPLKAIESCNRALNLSPNDSDLKELLESIKKDRKELVTAEKAVMENPGFAPAYYRLAAACNNLGLNELSLSYLEKTLELDPLSADSLFLSGSIYRSMDAKDTSNAFFRRARDIYEKRGNKIRLYLIDNFLEKSP